MTEYICASRSIKVIGVSGRVKKDNKILPYIKYDSHYIALPIGLYFNGKESKGGVGITKIL